VTSFATELATPAVMDVRTDTLPRLIYKVLTDLLLTSITHSFAIAQPSQTQQPRPYPVNSLLYQRGLNGNGLKTIFFLGGGMGTDKTEVPQRWVE